MFVIDKGKNISSNHSLNILYNHENIYIMDNHLAAIWCWSKSIDLNKNYSFLHIDRHDDLSLKSSNETVKYLQENRLKIEDIPIWELTELQVVHSDNRASQAFVWDNYINTFSLFYPNIFSLVFFSTQEDGNKVLPNLAIQRIDNFYLQDNLLYLLQNQGKNYNKWIINLDIDYFFTENNGFAYQYLTDEYIINLIKQLKLALDEGIIEVLTIAISPECCGDWSKGIRLANLVSEYLKIDFNYK